MPTIPTHILPTLITLGIVDPERATWRKADSWPLRRIRAHVYCQCGGGRIEQEFAKLGERAVFIGQCGKCGAICWREAVSDR